MKTLMMVTVLMGMNAAWAGQGAPILTCFSQASKASFRLNLSSLDSDIRGPEPIPCKSGIIMNPRAMIRYQVQFCPGQVMAQGFSEAQDDAGNWVRLQSFSTEAPLRNCEVFRQIEVAPGGMTGGHGNGHQGRSSPGRGGH